MRLIASHLVCIALAANIQSHLIAQEVSVEPTPSRILFRDSFTTQLSSAWRASDESSPVRKEDVWKVADGELWQSSPEGKRVLSIGDSSWGAIRVSFLFRQGPGNEKYIDTFLGVRGRGAYVVIRKGGGIGVAIDGIGVAQRTVLEQTPVQNAWNRLVIEYRPDSLFVTLNDVRGTSVYGIPFYEGGIELVTWQQSGWFKDFLVEGLPDERQGVSYKNLLRNSSFAMQSSPGIADYWSDGLGWAIDGAALSHVSSGYENYKKVWQVDKDTTRDGNVSLRVAAPLSLSSMALPLRKGSAYTFSVYLKSDMLGAATISVRSFTGKFKVEKEAKCDVPRQWERFHISIDKLPDARAFDVVITPAEKSFLWANSPQLEYGATPTEYVARPVAVSEDDVDARHVGSPLSAASEDCYFEKDFYTNEPTARLIIDALHVDAGHAEIAAQNRQDVRQDPLRVDLRENARWIEIPLAEVQEGESSTCLELFSAKGGAVRNIEPRIRRYPSESGGVKINQLSRAIEVDGQPRIIFSLIFCGTPSRDALNFYKKAGFEFVAISLEGGHGAKRALDDAAACGLKCVPWLPAPSAPEKAANHVNKSLEALLAQKRHPALLAWWIYDEPHLVGEPHRTFYQFMKDNDPFHPAIVNYTSGAMASGFDGLPGDILCYDDYPIPDRPITGVDFFSHIGGQISSARHQPAWVILSNMGNGYSRQRGASPQEHEYMAYVSIINGMTGIMYFHGLPRSEEVFNKFVQLRDEIKELEPMLLYGEPAKSLIDLGNERIKVRLVRHKEKIVILSVNSSRKAQSIETVLPFAKGGELVKVLFEGREVKLKSRTLSDVFAPYERHVYEINAKE